MSALGSKLSHHFYEGVHRIMWYCPGCKAAHSIRARLEGPPSPSWAVSGTPEEPIFDPSVLVWHSAGHWDEADAWVPNGQQITDCHCFVRAGQIQFLDDCRHELAGKTVPMPEWPANYGGR